MKQVINISFILLFLLLCPLFLNPNVHAQDILLNDDFNDSDNSEWFSINPWGSWYLNNGKYIGNAKLLSLPARPSYTIRGDTNWKNYTLETKIKGLQGIDKQILFYVNSAENRSYIFNFRSAYFNGGQDAILAKRIGLGSENAQLLQVTPFNNNSNTYYKLNIRVETIENSVSIKIYIDDELIIDYLDINNPIMHGSVGFEVVPGGYQAGNPIGLVTETEYDYINVLSLDTSINVPSLKQNDPKWSQVRYDQANLWSNGKESIERWGCALTSATMILQYYGHNVTPDSLNSWLIQNHGYVKDGLINWSAITRWALISNILNPLASKIEYKRLTYTLQSLTDEVDANRPAIVKLVQNQNSATHFVVAKGVNGNNVIINDPATNESALSYYAQHQPTRIDSFIPSNTDLSYLYIYAPTNINIKVLDQKLNSIDNVFADTETPIEDQVDKVIGIYNTLYSLAVPKPLPGKYYVQVTGNSEYNMKIHLYNKEANITQSTYHNTIKQNKIHTYMIDFGENIQNSSIVDYVFVIKSIETAYRSGKIKNKGVYTSLKALLNISQGFYAKNKYTNAHKLLIGAILEVKITKKYIAADYSNELIKLLEYINNSF